MDPQFSCRARYFLTGAIDLKVGVWGGTLTNNMPGAELARRASTSWNLPACAPGKRAAPVFSVPRHRASPVRHCCLALPSLKLIAAGLSALVCSCRLRAGLRQRPFPSRFNHFQKSRLGLFWRVRGDRLNARGVSPASSGFEQPVSNPFPANMASPGKRRSPQFGLHAWRASSCGVDAGHGVYETFERLGVFGGRGPFPASSGTCSQRCHRRGRET